MRTQQEKAVCFREMHAREGALLMPNPWDLRTARIIEQLGFEAIATSSSASANSAGRRDGELGRDLALAHARSLVEAIDLPVSGDLESGFATDPASVGTTIRLAADSGLVGCSIEDFPGGGSKAQFEISLAVERVRAAVEAARALPFPFTLTARAENYMHGNPSLDDAIRRLVAYEEAGADVLFAPGLPDLASVREVCASLKKPVNFMIGPKNASFSVAELVAAGVKRISFGTSLYRYAMTALVASAREARVAGTFSFLDQTLTRAELDEVSPGL